MEMMSPPCQCHCDRSGEFATVMNNNKWYPLAKKPTVDNGGTTDLYDDGEWLLVEEDSLFSDNMR